MIMMRLQLAWGGPARPAALRSTTEPRVHLQVFILLHLSLSSFSFIFIMISVHPAGTSLLIFFIHEEEGFNISFEI